MDVTVPFILFHDKIILYTLQAQSLHNGNSSCFKLLYASSIKYPKNKESCFPFRFVINQQL